MSQFIFFAVVSVAAYYCYKTFVREADRVTAKVRRERKQQVNGAQGTLVQDPVTGVYRVVKD